MATASPRRLEVPCRAGGRKALFVALAMLSAHAFAQADGGVSDARPVAAARDEDEIRREIDAKVEAAKKEMREELRAQLATQSVAQGWQEEWVEEKRKLELFTLDGYFRVRPELFNKLDLNRAADPAGFYLFPHSPISSHERTTSGANMRLRFEPTLNISEEVRVRMQLDVFDNTFFGSTPDFYYTQAYNQFSVLSETQVPPTAGINSPQNSIVAKRAYGEVTTPVGILRFGRMGSHWGLGVMHNDGNCLDCDFGDTVDRIQFVSNPLPGWYVTPMIDFNITGPLAYRGVQGEPYPLSDTTSAHSYVLVIARRDTDQEAKAKIESGQSVLNGGIHVTYRTQANDPINWLTSAFNPIDPNCNTGQGSTANSLCPSTAAYNNFVYGRGAAIWMPDVWAKYERKQLRIEAEFGAVIGSMNSADLVPAYDSQGGSNFRGITLWQYGGVLQAEGKLVDNKLRLGLELGFASGAPTPGYGFYQGRPGSGQYGAPQYGDIDGPKFFCYPGNVTPPTGQSQCPTATIQNFRFNRDYRVDEILFREVLGGITGAMYAKPTVSYELAEGLKLFGAAIYSRALFLESTPSAHIDATTGKVAGDQNLGLELNVGARYETEDGFIAGVTWAVLFPLGGLADNSNAAAPNLDTAQSVRGWLGIKF